MSGPKHLWSGDWERESQAAGQRDDARPSPPEPHHTEPSGRPPSRRRWSPGVALAVLLAVALITGAAFGLSALVSGGSKPPSRQASVPTAGTPFGPQGTTPQSPQLTSPQQPTPQTGTQTGTTTTTPYTNNTIVDWLGMQIQTNAPGDVVIDTVRLGSSADAAAINPGEQLVSVNGHTLVSATDIAGAIKGLHHGEQVPIEISDGAATQVYYLPLGAPPSRHP